MNELLHPPFNYSMRPDLGGTRYDYTKEISRDKVTYIVRNPISVTKLEIPGSDDFLHMSVETPEGDIFTEAYYTFLGDLTSAHLWFTRYCRQVDFASRATPSRKFLNNLDRFVEAGTEIMLEANVAMQRLCIYYCDADSDADDPDLTAGVDIELPAESTLLKYDPKDPDLDVDRVGLYVNLSDNVLNLGFLTGEKYIGFDTFSTVVNIDKLIGEKATPGDVRKILESILLKY